MKDLHKKLSVDILPEELGGKLGPADALAEVSCNHVNVAIQTKSHSLIKVLQCRRVTFTRATTVEMK